MTYDGERTYPESEWAAQRWDWFHGGRIVEPLSFCQFWRTVLIWATIKWFFTPFLWLDRVTTGLTMPVVPTPTIPWRFGLLPVKGCWLLLRVGTRGLWRLTYPLRCAARPVGGAALAGAVGAGERVETFYKGHKAIIDIISIGLVITIYGGFAVLILVFVLLASWFWTLIAISGATVGSFAGYGFFKSGALRLLWDVAVVVHHGICPPIRILR